MLITVTLLTVVMGYMHSTIAAVEKLYSDYCYRCTGWNIASEKP